MDLWHLLTGRPGTSWIMIGGHSPQRLRALINKCKALIPTFPEKLPILVALTQIHTAQCGSPSEIMQQMAIEMYRPTFTLMDSVTLAHPALMTTTTKGSPASVYVAAYTMDLRRLATAYGSGPRQVAVSMHIACYKGHGLALASTEEETAQEWRTRVEKIVEGQE